MKEERLSTFKRKGLLKDLPFYKKKGNQPTSEGKQQRERKWGSRNRDTSTNEFRRGKEEEGRKNLIRDERGREESNRGKGEKRSARIVKGKSVKTDRHQKKKWFLPHVPFRRKKKAVSSLRKNHFA